MFNGKFLPEPQEGNIEYKLRLDTMTPLKLVKMQTQLRWRMTEGEGYAIYYIGIKDDGTSGGLSLDNIIKSVEIFKNIIELESSKHEVTYSLYDFGYIAEVKITSSSELHEFTFI